MDAILREKMVTPTVVETRLSEEPGGSGAVVLDMVVVVFLSA
jgi:hypothetical protein